MKLLYKLTWVNSIPSDSGLCLRSSGPSGGTQLCYCLRRVTPLWPLWNDADGVTKESLLSSCLLVLGDGRGVHQLLFGLKRLNRQWCLFRSNDEKCLETNIACRSESAVILSLICFTAVWRWLPQILYCFKSSFVAYICSKQFRLLRFLLEHATIEKFVKRATEFEVSANPVEMNATLQSMTNSSPPVNNLCS